MPTAPTEDPLANRLPLLKTHWLIDCSYWRCRNMPTAPTEDPLANRLPLKKSHRLIDCPYWLSVGTCKWTGWKGIRGCFLIYWRYSRELCVGVVDDYAKPDTACSLRKYFTKPICKTRLSVLRKIKGPFWNLSLSYYCTSTRKNLGFIREKHFPSFKGQIVLKDPDQTVFPNPDPR